MNPPPKSTSSTYEIEPMFEEISEGQNYLFVKCVAANKYDSTQLQVVFDLKPQVTSYTTLGKVFTWGKIVAIIVLVAGSSLLAIRLAKRRKAS